LNTTMKLLSDIMADGMTTGNVISAMSFGLIVPTMTI
jgi:hypothetical protein